MDTRFHRRVQVDLNEALVHYAGISDQLADDFFAEFQLGVGKVRTYPRFFHFDACGLRRCNFDRFPYHFLYDIRDRTVRVWVLRHDQ